MESHEWYDWAQKFTSLVDEWKIMEAVDQRKARTGDIGQMLEAKFMLPAQDRPRPESNFQKGASWDFGHGELPFSKNFLKLCWEMDHDGDADGWLSWKDVYEYIKSLPGLSEDNSFVNQFAEQVG